MRATIVQLKMIPCAASILLLAAVGTFIAHPVLYTNFTHSMPLGVYLALDRPAHQGDDVVFASDRVRSFGLHLPPILLKHYAYGSGAQVNIDLAGLSVSGRLVAPRVVRIGRTYSGIVQPHRAIVLGEDPRSFDSRYFGPVPEDSLQPVEPLLTWSAK